MSSHFKPYTPISSQLQAISSQLRAIPVYSSLFQSIPTYSSLFQPIPAYSSLFQPFLAYLFKGAGYSEGLRQTNKDARLLLPFVYHRIPKRRPYNQ
jgi:hypothetical protein